MRKTPVAIVVGATAVAVLAGGGVAYAAMDKTVHLNVDGRNEVVHSLAGNVQGVLDGADVTTGTRDLVAPRGTSSIRDGDHVVVRHARPVKVTVDGRSFSKWVTALNVAEALDQLGFGEKGTRVSADRSTRIPLSGYTFSISTPKHVTIVNGGKKKKMLTTASTVAGALAAAGIKPDKDDEVSPAETMSLTDGDRVTVTRIKVDTTKKTVTIPAPVKEEKTKKLLDGHTKVKKAGRDGKKVISYQRRTVNGKVQKMVKTGEHVVVTPKTKVVLVGTKAPPNSSAPSDGSFWTLGGLNWRALAKCESGMNPRAVNPNGHYGLIQFSLSTWAAVGGEGNPIDASSQEQIERGYTLYKRAGEGQWSCGYHLHD